ncbi:hypothetical protein FI667_g4627, partial [Globisporangium splendens]
MLRDDFESYKYSILVTLTEFGCTSLGFPTMKNKVGVFKGQRTFHDAKWTNSIDYSEYFAGGFTFEYTTENANSKSTSKYPFTEFGPQNYGLGYLSPEDWDDVKKPRSYVQMPNFDNLAKAYQVPDSSKEPTLKTFKPAANRVAHPKCPAGYPALRDCQWTGGLKPTSKCPTNTPKFQCPKKARKATTASSVTSGSTASDSKSSKKAANAGSSDSASGGVDADDTKTPAPTKSTPKQAAVAEESETLKSDIENDPSVSDGSKSGNVATDTVVKASDASQVASSTAPVIAIAALVIALVQHF